jgi:hypothetical protein
MLLKASYPELSLEFDVAKNDSISLDEITAGSGRKVWWLCNNGHSWQSVVSSRIKNGLMRKCPFCKGLKPSEINNFATENKDLLLIWDYKKNIQNPKQFTPRSNKKVFWICKKGHSWQNTIKRTVLQKGKCPVCSEKKSVSIIHNLQTKFPELMEFWDFEKNINPPIIFAPFSSKKVYWKCVNGHSYLQPIVHKTRAGYGCPKCKIKGSRNEVRIYCELKHIGFEVFLRHKINGTEFDLYFPKLKMAIEYDGSYFHKNRRNADIRKNEIANNLEIKLIRIREKPLKPLFSDDLITTNKWLTKKDVNSIFLKIFTGLIDGDVLQRYVNYSQFQNESLYNEELKYLIIPKGEEAITNTHPDIAKQWDYEKNFPLTPDQFSQGSEKKVWWKCPKFHSWKAAIDKRTGSKRDAQQNCLICSNAIPHIDYNLSTEIKGVEELWDYSKNKFTPTEYLPTSGKIVNWKCSKGHEFRASIVSRVNSDTKSIRDCIYCNGTVASEENNLLKFCSDVVNHWDYERNINISPVDFLPSSNKKVWWKCKTGHTFQQRIIDKIHPKKKEVRTCRKCAAHSWNENNNLARVFPFLLVEWDYEKNKEIDPNYITPYSNLQVFWKCSKGHTFVRAPYQRINRKTKSKRSCPVCWENS